MKSNTKTGKWYLSLATDDYGGGCDEGDIFDSLDKVLANGAYYIKNKVNDWYQCESEVNPDEVDEHGFNELLKQNFKEIIKHLVDLAKNAPAHTHTYSFGPMIDCVNNVRIVLRKATESDDECDDEW
jgi:hypothetical protein